VLPVLQQSATLSKQTLIFVPTYFEFVQLRNYLYDHEVDFMTCSEYTKDRDVSRARTAFFHGRTAFLIITERFYFFQRLRIRGTKHVVFYGLPEHANFYPEILSFLALEDDGLQNFSSLCLYTRYDALKLERIVGSSRVERILRGEKSTFMFA